MLYLLFVLFYLVRCTRSKTFCVCLNYYFFNRYYYVNYLRFSLALLKKYMSYLTIKLFFLHTFSPKFQLRFLYKFLKSIYRHISLGTFKKNYFSIPKRRRFVRFILRYFLKTKITYLLKPKTEIVIVCAVNQIYLTKYLVNVTKNRESRTKTIFNCKMSTNTLLDILTYFMLNNHNLFDTNKLPDVSFFYFDLITYNFLTKFLFWGYSSARQLHPFKWSNYKIFFDLSFFLKGMIFIKKYTLIMDLRKTPQNLFFNLHNEYGHTYFISTTGRITKLKGLRRRQLFSFKRSTMRAFQLMQLWNTRGKFKKYFVFLKIRYRALHYFRKFKELLKAFIKSLKKSGFDLIQMHDQTPIAYGGCRLTRVKRKKRRNRSPKRRVRNLKPTY